MPGIAQEISGDTSCDNNDTSYQNLSTGNGKPAFHSFDGSPISRNGFWSQHRDVSHSQLQKFWCELSPQARRKLLRIDKQALFEHARKNMYCSRCNGLLLEGFSQIVMYGKSLDQDAAGSPYTVNATDDQNDVDLCMANGSQDVVRDPLIHPWGGLATAKDGTLTLLDCYLCSKSLKGLQNVFDSARARERERELLYPDACGGGGRGWISQGVVGYGRGHGTREACALHTARLSVETLVDFWSALGEETRQSLLRMKEEDFIDRLVYRFESKRFCRDCRRNVIREFKELKELKRMRKQTRCTSWFCVADTAFQYEVSHDTVQADWHQEFSEAFGTYHHFEWAIGSGEGKTDILEFENVGLRGKVQVNGLDLIGLNACYITLRAWRMDGRCNELCVKAHALRGQQCVHRRLVVGDGFLTITRGESITRFFEHAEEAEEEEDDDYVDKDGNDLDVDCTRPQKHAKSPELAREFLLDAATVIFKEQVEKAFREGTARQNAHSIFVCLALKLLEECIYVACKDIITLEKQTKLLEEEEKEKREEEERKERRRTKEREKKLRRKERLREKENREKKCVEPDLTSVDQEASVDQGVNDVPDVDYEDERGEASQSDLLSPDIQDTCSNTENPSDDILDEEFDNTSDWNTSFSYDQIKYSRRKESFCRDSQQGSNLKWSDRKRGPTRSENGFEFTRSVNAFSKQLKTNAARSNLNKYHHHTEHRSRSEPQITRAALPDVSKLGKKYNHAQTKINTPKKVWEPLDSKKKCIRSNSDSDITLRSTLKVEPSESDKLPECSSSSSDEVADVSLQTSQEDNDVRDLTGSKTKPQDSSTSTTSSNSDNFSSCLSDGTSTSDSEESIQISDGKEISDRHKNPREQDDRIQEAEKERKESISTSSQPHSVLPQINYPVFQAPAMGYYNQNPVSWPSNSVNGLMPFPHSNHCLFPYGFRYGAFQHLTPVFQQVSQVSTNATGLKEVDCSTPKVHSTDDKTDVGNNSFSLFHFGGPVALSSRFKPDQMSLNEGIMEDMKKSSANCPDSNHPCGKEDSVEEYNLFAATKGITFSIV